MQEFDRNPRISIPGMDILARSYYRNQSTSKKKKFLDTYKSPVFPEMKPIKKHGKQVDGFFVLIPNLQELVGESSNQLNKDIQMVDHIKEELKNIFI